MPPGIRPIVGPSAAMVSLWNKTEARRPDWQAGTPIFISASRGARRSAGVGDLFVGMNDVDLRHVDLEGRRDGGVVAVLVRIGVGIVAQRPIEFVRIELAVGQMMSRPGGNPAIPAVHRGVAGEQTVGV